MENAAEALKLAFAVFVFVMALSICISTFSLARETADMVLSSSDETKYYEYEDTGSTEYREVGLETIIPTLYKYNKENYKVIFAKGSYDATSGTITIEGFMSLYKSARTNEEIATIDLNEERERSEPWTGSNTEIKNFLDCLVMGGNYNFLDGTDNQLNFQQGIIQKFEEGKFLELIGKEQPEESEESEGSTNNLNKTTTKTIITYVKIN